MDWYDCFRIAFPRTTNIWEVIEYEDIFCHIDETANVVYSDGHAGKVHINDVDYDDNFDYYDNGVFWNPTE